MCRALKDGGKRCAADTRGPARAVLAAIHERINDPKVSSYDKQMKLSVEDRAALTAYASTPTGRDELEKLQAVCEAQYSELVRQAGTMRRARAEQGDYSRNADEEALTHRARKYKDTSRELHEAFQQAEAYNAACSAFAEIAKQGRRLSGSATGYDALFDEDARWEMEHWNRVRAQFGAEPVTAEKIAEETRDTIIATYKQMKRDFKLPKDPNTARDKLVAASLPKVDEIIKWSLTNGSHKWKYPEQRKYESLTRAQKADAAAVKVDDTFGVDSCWGRMYTLSDVPNNDRRGQIEGPHGYRSMLRRTLDADAQARKTRSPEDVAEAARLWGYMTLQYAYAGGMDRRVENTFYAKQEMWEAVAERTPAA